jgi:peptidoglycan/LPS O-acetylase OafA/YrhL
MRFHNLQLLRVAAAVGVVAFHLGVHGGILGTNSLDWLRTGPWAFFPVPVFFALSGFVLTHALQSAPRGRFLFGRFLRLYPGYWLAVLFGLAILRFAVWPPLQAAGARFSTTAWLLAPLGADNGFYVLGGVEWSLIYEVFLSLALTAFSLLGIRRGLPWGIAVWIAVLLTKTAFWPNFATAPFPHWSTIFLSAYSLPFLLGVMAYYLREVGRRWRWVVFAATLGFAALGAPKLGYSRELTWCAWGAIGALAVWFAVQVKQVRATHPLARLGDYTYGLYLVHVPVLLAVYYRAVLRRWEMPPEQVAILAGGLALVVGFAFGKAESTLHGLLRPLAKWNPSRRAGSASDRSSTALQSLIRLRAPAHRDIDRSPDSP